MYTVFRVDLELKAVFRLAVERPPFIKVFPASSNKT
jgi:hypothetical protein